MNRLPVLVAALLLAPSVRAGVTIHYEGYAASADAVAQIIAVAKLFADKHHWKTSDASAHHGKLERVIEEKNKDYEGEISGVVLYPNSKCEPVYLQFGNDLFMQDFVKTQFAGADTHRDIIALFDAIKPSFRKLVIDDEGDYWETRDRVALEKHIATVNKTIEELKKQKPNTRTSVVLPSGRIADVIQ
jgi:hypothetical protein